MSQTISSDRARANWRDVIDTASAGNNIVVERYGKPLVAIIAYQDFLALEALIEELHDVRDAGVALEEWRQNASIARTWEDVKGELLADES